MVLITPEGPDYTLALPELLRYATKTIHDDTAGMESVGWLTRGELSREEYVRYLMMLYHIYDTLEAALEKHAAHPVLAPTYNPAMLARAPRLESDIAHILDVPESEWKAHPIHVGLQTSPPPALGSYLARIRQLSEGGDASSAGGTAQSPEPERLLAHSYVRYVGDLSGGQVIRRVIAKAYDLHDGLGTSFYGFSKLGESSRDATIGDMGKIKDWFRKGMDEGVGSDEKLKRTIVEESIQTFKFNIAMLSSLTKPIPKESSVPDDVQASPRPVEWVMKTVQSFLKGSA